MAIPKLTPVRIWLPFWGWLIFIFALSTYPKAIIPQVKYISWDKIAHILEFGILGYLTARAWYFSGRRMLHANWIRLALVFGILYAASDEWHQLYVPGRFASWFDVFADSLGVILGLGLFAWLKSRRSKIPAL